MSNFRGLFTESQITQTPRLFPGGLSVSRTIGDIYAKDPLLGGNPKVTIATPDIYHHTFTQEDRLLMFATDGIIDVLSDSQMTQIVNSSYQDGKKLRLSKQQIAGNIASDLVNSAFNVSTSTDNLSCVVVVL
jgi:protein phosphatase PTC2/3